MNITDLDKFASILDHPLRLVAIPQERKLNQNNSHIVYVVDICARKIGALERLNTTHNLYYHINPDKDPMHKGKSKDTDIDRICFLGLDYDEAPTVTLDQLEIIPSCTIATSPSLNKFQHLIALDNTTFDITKYKTIARRFSTITGSDPSCIDIARIFRLPGSINLKVNEESKLIDYAKEQTLYTYDELNALLDNYEEKLEEVMANSGVHVEGVKTRKKKKNRNDRIKEDPDSNYEEPAKDEFTVEPEIVGIKLGDITIRDAIKLAKAGKKIKCKGNRHNNRVSWSSSMALNVVRGKCTKEKAISVVHKLIDLFDPPFEPHDLAQEKTMVIKDIEAFIDKDMKASASIYNDIPLKKNLSNLASSGVRAGEEDSDEDSDEDNDGVKVASTDLSVVTGNELAYMSESGFSLVNLTMVKKVLKHIDVISLFKAYALFRDNDGSTKEVIAILSKAILDSGIQISNQIVFEKGVTNSWGYRSHHLYVPEKMDIIYEWVSNLIGHTKDILGRKDVIEEIKNTKDYKQVCDYIKEGLMVEMINPKTGLIDHKALGIELKKRIVRIFRHPFKNAKEKEIIVKALCHKIAVEHIGNVNENSALTVVFQNGKWVRGKGFVKCEAWRESINSSPCRVLELVQGDIKDKIIKKEGDKIKVEARGENFGAYVQRYRISHRSLAGVLELWCPHFARYLRNAFGTDYASWTKVVLMLGYSLTTTNPLRKIFFLYGESTSGKNMLAKVFMGIIGNVNGVVIQYDNIPGEYEGLDKAINKQFCIIDEPSPKNEKLIHARVGTKLKRATSGEVLQVRGIRQGSVEHRFETKFMVVSNDPPQFVDSAGSFKARLVPLFFGNAYVGVQDALLADKILSHADELATIALSVLSYAMTIQDIDNKVGMFRDLFDFGDSIVGKLGGIIENKTQDKLSGVDPIIKAAVNECVKVGSPNTRIKQEGILAKLIDKSSYALDLNQLQITLGNDEIEAQAASYIRSTLGATGRIYQGSIALRGVTWVS